MKTVVFLIIFVLSSTIAFAEWYAPSDAYERYTALDFQGKSYEHAVNLLGEPVSKKGKIVTWRKTIPGACVYNAALKMPLCYSERTLTWVGVFDNGVCYKIFEEKS